jgi:act minimal PKS acyl carrier protein
MTIEDLRRVLTACAGESDAASWDEDILDWGFDDLGYDSLARMETAAHIEQAYGVHIPDEDITELRTPRQVLDFVNGALATT